MSTLLLRLSAPMQAWGAESKFDTRTTQRAPTKSGVIGMVAAALGRRRTEPIDDLQRLRFGVRVDQEGTLMVDFHMAHEQSFWDSGADNGAHLTRRHYLSDATFLVGLEGADTQLLPIQAALQSPAFPLFLGRRSCPPEGKVVLGVRKDMPLRHALEQAPWLASARIRARAPQTHMLRLYLEADAGDASAYAVRDVPVSFSQMKREHGFRFIEERTVPIASGARRDITTHDPMMELEG